MIVRSYNPVERGRPAVWIEGVLRSFQDFTRIRSRALECDAELPAGDPLDIVMNGGGGASTVGLDVYTMLRCHPRQKRVTILNAPSMGSVIAMAGDEIRIIEGGTVFLHTSRLSNDLLVNDPVVTHQPARALRSLAALCEAVDILHADIFCARTGLDRGTIVELRERETTLDAAAAVEFGFADYIVPLSATIFASTEDHAHAQG